MLDLIARTKNWIAAETRSYVSVPLFRNAHALMLNTVATSGLGVVYWVLAARYYDRESVGLSSAAISTMMFLSGLAQLNMGSALNRFVPQAGPQTRRLIGSIYLVSSALAAVIAIVFVITSQWWLKAGNFLEGSAPFAVLYTLSVVLWGIFALQDGAITGLRQAFWLPIENASFGVVKLVLLILFAPIWPVYGIFASWTIPMMLSLIPVNYLIFRRLVPQHVASTKGDGSEVTLKGIGTYVTGDYIGSLFYLSSTALLPILVANELGGRQNAYFYIAWVIGSSLDLFSSNMATSLTVEATADRAELVAYSKKSLIHMARILTPLAIVLLVGAPILLSIFGSDYASNAAALLRLLGLAILPKAFNTLFLGNARVQRHMGRIVLVQAALCALVLSLSITLAGVYGITGIGIAWLSSQTIVAVILAVTWLGPALLGKPGKTITAPKLSD